MPKPDLSPDPQLFQIQESIAENVIQCYHEAKIGRDNEVNTSGITFNKSQQCRRLIELLLIIVLLNNTDLVNASLQQFTSFAVKKLISV